LHNATRYAAAVQRKSFADMNCSIAQCLEIVGEWWTLLILRDVFLGYSRFDEFESRLGIARNVLTQRLERLVDAGVLERVPYQERPVRHDYLLTEKGRDLWQVVTAMRQWGDRWAAPGGAPVELVHRACGEVVDVVPSCSHCGEQLTTLDVQARPGPGLRTTPAPPRRRRALQAG
jgi:DNA-binding HxlR family transcriptional regulator